MEIKNSKYIKLEEVEKIIKKYSSQFSGSKDLISVSVNAILTCVGYEVANNLHPIIVQEVNTKGYYNG